MRDQDPEYCSRFDRALAEHGLPAVFLRDPEGHWRFDPEWTRDAWGRLEGEPRAGRRWALARDRDTGYVHPVLVTSPDLLARHPRLDVRLFDDPEAADRALAELGRPPLAKVPW